MNERMTVQIEQTEVYFCISSRGDEPIQGCLYLSYISQKLCQKHFVDPFFIIYWLTKRLMPGKLFFMHPWTSLTVTSLQASMLMMKFTLIDAPRPVHWFALATHCTIINVWEVKPLTLAVRSPFSLLTVRHVVQHPLSSSTGCEGCWSSCWERTLTGTKDEKRLTSASHSVSPPAFLL